MENKMSGQTQESGNVLQQHEQRDFLVFNHILEIVRDAFLAIHQGLAGEEQWRWDVPVITFSWENGRELKRNINGFVRGETKPIALEIESNAWCDVRESSEFVRYWRNFSAGQLGASSMTDADVSALVEKAYIEVSSWTKKDIENRVVLTTGGQS